MCVLSVAPNVLFTLQLIYSDEERPFNTTLRQPLVSHTDTIL